MQDVFVYFVSIGAGLALGISLGAIPAVIYYKNWGVTHDSKAKKANRY